MSMFLKEPFNALSHFFGFSLAFIATRFLLAKTRTQSDLIHNACGIYSFTLMALFFVSSLYHAIDVNPTINATVQKLDHICIFLLIAGTYTPISLLGLHGTRHMGQLFFAEWGTALIGITLKLWWFTAPYWLHVAFYIAMGWMIFPFLGTLLRTSGRETIFWLISGGFFYTLGAIIDATALTSHPHQTFHIMTLLGAGLHFKMIWHLVRKNSP